jgi:hypothetical protein
MKIVQIVPREELRLYAGLIEKEAKKELGIFYRGRRVI